MAAGGILNTRKSLSITFLKISKQPVSFIFPITFVHVDLAL